MHFNEDLRVKTPALSHPVCSGYPYVVRRKHNRIKEANIFPVLFKASISKINPEFDVHEIERLLTELSLKIYYDLGREFYKSLTATSSIKLIDFENFKNSSFHITNESTCKNGEDEFRADITVLINEMLINGRLW